MVFFVYVKQILPKLYLRSSKTPKSREHALGMSECVIVQKHGNVTRHSPYFTHDRDIACAIAIAKIDRSRNPAHRFQLMTRIVIPGVQTPKMSIRSGHRRVPNTRHMT